MFAPLVDPPIEIKSNGVLTPDGIVPLHAETLISDGQVMSGRGVIVTAPLEMEEHPLGLVTVTEYVPAIFVLKFFVLPGFVAPLGRLFLFLRCYNFFYLRRLWDRRKKNDRQQTNS